MTEHAVTPHAIRHRAHERWLERGSPHGSPEQDWLEAERELLADAARADGRAPGVAAIPAVAVASAPVAAPPVTSSGSARRRAPRSIVTRAATSPAARLLAALVPEAAPDLGAGARSASHGRR